MMPKFDWSLKAQMLAPKKMYVIDPGLFKLEVLTFRIEVIFLKQLYIGN